MDYKQKYLKYKQKYVELKKQLGGVRDYPQTDTTNNWKSIWNYIRWNAPESLRHQIKLIEGFQTYNLFLWWAGNPKHTHIDVFEIGDGIGYSLKYRGEHLGRPGRIYRDYDNGETLQAFLMRCAQILWEKLNILWERQQEEERGERDYRRRRY